MLTAAPGDPHHREGVNIWLQDDDGRFAFPRIGVEAIGASWDHRGVQANIAFPDGRVLVGSCAGPARGPRDGDGRPMVIGAGPIEFRCLEPFGRWTMSFHGPAVDTTVEEQLARAVPAREPVDVGIELEMTMARPPWVRGQARATDRALDPDSDEALFVGGVGGRNIKQLFRARGTFRVGGSQVDFTATGLRVHRTGRRDTENFRGHCWQSALFPDGRAFEALVLAPEPGVTPYSEGFVDDGHGRRRARVVTAPWMTSLEPHGGDVTLALETDDGRIEIGATTHSTSVIAGSGPMSTLAASPTASRHDLLFHQGSARYSWDGQVAYGMVERSLPIAAIHTVTS